MLKPKFSFTGETRPGDGKSESSELAEIKRITEQDNGHFNIISPQERDSLGTDVWKEYLNSEKLLDAWSPPHGSPYRQFFKTKTIKSVDFVGARIKPRYSELEEKCLWELSNLFESGELGNDTAVILDSGAAHSVAIAARLAEHGFQPVVMFDSIPHSRGMTRSQQGLATLLYFAGEMQRLKQQNKIKPDAPPVFVLDTHRRDVSKDKGEYNNTYLFKETDFPSAEDLVRRGIKKIVYLNEADQAGRINSDFQSVQRLAGDMKKVGQKWMRAGIKIVYTGISPVEVEDDVDSNDIDEESIV